MYPWIDIAKAGGRAGRRTAFRIGSRSATALLAVAIAATAHLVPGATGAAPSSSMYDSLAGEHVLQFERCRRDVAAPCVIDGDTLDLGKDRIRIADIDTPEIFSPACPAEKERGEIATWRMLALLNAGPFKLARGERDRDRYGRKLRVILRENRSLGEILVAEGLAERWGGSKIDWCA